MDTDENFNDYNQIANTEQTNMDDHASNFSFRKVLF